MNYSRVYNSIVNRAKDRKKQLNDGMHRHHIVPVSLGGSNSPFNLVVLTPREHFICHALLVKMQEPFSVERFKMLSALRRLNFDGLFNSRRYASYYKEYSSFLREKMLGKNNPNYGGKYQTEEVKARMRKPKTDSSKMGRWERSEEYRQSWSERQKKNSHFVGDNPMNSKEMRNKVAASKIGRRAHVNTEYPGVMKLIRPGEAPPGWVLKS